MASQTITVHGVKLGVVELATFSAGAHAEVREAVERELHEGARGIVFDLRANGGGLVEEAAADREHLHPEGHDRDYARAHPADDTLSAVGGAISDLDPAGRARRRTTRPRPPRS